MWTHTTITCSRTTTRRKIITNTTWFQSLLPNDRRLDSERESVRPLINDHCQGHSNNYIIGDKIEIGFNERLTIIHCDRLYSECTSRRHIETEFHPDWSISKLLCSIQWTDPDPDWSCTVRCQTCALNLLRQIKHLHLSITHTHTAMLIHWHTILCLFHSISFLRCTTQSNTR